MPKTATETGSRRSNGEGTFSLRADGRWQGARRFGGNRYTAYGATRQECFDKLKAKIAEARAGKPTPSKMTVRQYLLKYLEVRSVDYKPGPLQSATYVLLNQVTPALGDIKLCDLSLDDAQRLVLLWKQRGLKGITIRGYFSYFRKAMNHAVKTKLLPYSPCAGAVLPKAQKIERATLTRDNIAALLSIFKGHWFYAIFVLFLATGLRSGELRALKWEDIDFEAGTLQVRRGVVWVSGVGMVEDTPKTEASARTIVLLPFVLDMLRQHGIDQEEQRWLAGEHWREHGLVFCRAWGDHMRPRTLSYALTTMLKKANIPHVLIHGLRHTTATTLLSMRVNPKVVQELLGHANVEETLNTYGHCLPGEHRESMTELNVLFFAPEVSRAVKMAVSGEDWIEGEWREVA